jgi:hypothetical protein
MEDRVSNMERKLLATQLAEQSTCEDFNHMAKLVLQMQESTEADREKNSAQLHDLQSTLNSIVSMLKSVSLQS